MTHELLLPLLLRIACVLHLGIALVYAFLQQRYAVRFARAHTDRSKREPEGSFLPSVDVLVPCYNEDPVLLDACLTALAKQDYQGQLKVFVVDDGSRNRDFQVGRLRPLSPVLERHRRRPGWRITLLDGNVGKRLAIDAAFKLGDSDAVVTVDSDAVLLPDAVSQVVRPLADQRVGAVAASNRVRNATNALTRLINRSYWLLFEVERAAQSYFRAVLCCHGAFSAYRRTALESVWDRHLNQTFLGHRCRSGDDMHLTLELLASGYDTVLQPSARARTVVPDRLRPYFRQQLRWNRSFIRELWWAAGAISGRHAYLTFDVVVQVVTPLLKGVVALLFLCEGAVLGAARLSTGDIDVGFVLVETGLALATLLSTSTLGALQARSFTYVLFGLVYLGLILPSWLQALVSVGQDTWRTRDLPPARRGEHEPQQLGGC